MITQQQRDLRNAIVKHAEESNLDLNTTTYSLIVVLGSVIEGIPVERALGSPGSWGYGTPIGDALLALIQSQLESPEQSHCKPPCVKPDPAFSPGRPRGR